MLVLSSCLENKMSELLTGQILGSIQGLETRITLSLSVIHVTIINPQFKSYCWGGTSNVPFLVKVFCIHTIRKCIYTCCILSSLKVYLY